MRQVVEMQVDETTYKLFYNLNTLCDVEEKANKGFPAFAAELSDPEKVSLTAARILLWAGLKKYQPDVTLFQAGDIISAAGGVVPVLAKITEALGGDAGPAKVAA